MAKRRTGVGWKHAKKGEREREAAKGGYGMVDSWVNGENNAYTGSSSWRLKRR
jgi:hypothetical protein